MCAVIASADGQKQNIQVENVCKVQRDRDGTAFPGVVWGLAVDSFGCLVSSPVRVVLSSAHSLSNPKFKEAYVRVSDPWLSAVRQSCFTPVLRSNLLELRVEVLDDKIRRLLD